ncbi:FHA domain-containing protein [Salinithrix halophila]|uniref:FHA domain-containing protein n=1 Tax=Salinithrix halophila TaxID=1485204 RepID=A0ABV8JI87_9BACL
MESGKRLYVEKGAPFPAGTPIDLKRETTRIGRDYPDGDADLSFANEFISRQHVSIRLDGEKAWIMDLGSKHGTTVGTEELVPHIPRRLNNSDIIRLAKGVVVLHFAYVVPDHTLDLDPGFMTQEEPPILQQLFLDQKRRVCIVSGKPVALSGKEWNLLAALHDHSNTFVSNDEIIRRVWPERQPFPDGMPPVGLVEVNSLVYRVRKKIKKAATIVNVRGKGYYLELK